MKECIIIENKNICPHEEISGKKCSACKIPDEYVKELKILKCSSIVR